MNETYANSADPDQTPKIRVFTVCLQNFYQNEIKMKKYTGHSLNLKYSSSEYTRQISVNKAAISRKISSEIVSYHVVKVMFASSHPTSVIYNTITEYVRQGIN